MGLHVPNFTDCVDEGVVAHMRGCEGLDGQVCNLVTQLVVTSGDKAAILKSREWDMDNCAPNPLQLGVYRRAPCRSEGRGHSSTPDPPVPFCSL